MKPVILRAAITPDEYDRLRIDAIRAKVSVQEHIATLLREAMAAREDGTK